MSEKNSPRLSHNRHALHLLTTLCSIVGTLGGTASALPGGRATVTPDLSVLPLQGFRLELGMVGTENVISIKSGRRGDLWGLYIRIDYGAASNAVLTVEGIGYKSFVPEHGGGTAAVGDFTVWGKFVLGEGPHDRGGYGVRFGAKLPNTPSNKDFGTNETDFFMHLFAGTTAADWQLSAYGGIGILDRPEVSGSQDDIAMGGVLGRRNTWGGVVSVELEGFTKSRIYGNNWGLHLVWEHPAKAPLGYMVAAQLSHGKLYGTFELRAGLVLRF
jgi:hypothetical protein